ncbi:RagB/SusD family nutrient uptake outer membrane protein [Bacteroides sp.]|uniref:RagB/SusD family nutrient uptake outer membrane protein n=1 Tax=Bacteroides sp. TaxID=29523 RepID=UPI002FC87AC3
MAKIKQYFMGMAIIVMLTSMLTGCQDLKFGDDSLAKAPGGGDTDIDLIYSNAQYARRALWEAYSTLPYGVNAGNTDKLGWDILECITDLNHSCLGWDGCGSVIYYGGAYTADLENSSGSTKYNYTRENNWTGIRRAFLFLQNVDRVPDMDAKEKAQLKAEAKMVIAVHYSDMFRHFGGLPWIDHAYNPTEDFKKERETALNTLEKIVGLIDEAAADLPWALQGNELVEWEGRFTRAAALGLKARILLFGASPLFNSAAPYLEGEASAKQLTWYGKYMPELWERARVAHENFFNELQQKGGYDLVRSGKTPRDVFRSAYFDRGNGEILISTRVCYAAPDFWDGNYGFMQAAGDYGTAGPTNELVEQFGMKESGLSIYEDPKYDPKNPYKGRDPRLYETVVVNGDIYYGRTAEIYVGGRDNQSNAAYGPWKTGYRLRKFLLDGGGATQYEWPAELTGKVVQWPYLRLSELYLGYAEAICKATGSTANAYKYVNEVRARVGVGALKPGLSPDQFIEAVLTERVCELSFEEVRWFDMIRYKREDLFKKTLHALEITKNEAGGFNYTLKELAPRYWSKTFSPKWYLSAFPSNEINKGYGLIQNPGW